MPAFQERKEQLGAPRGLCLGYEKRFKTCPPRRLRDLLRPAVPHVLAGAGPWKSTVRRSVEYHQRNVPECGVRTGLHQATNAESATAVVEVHGNSVRHAVQHEHPVAIDRKYGLDGRLSRFSVAQA